MKKERTVITQELCDHIKALLAGGLTYDNAAKYAKVGQATVSRIKAAGFDAVKYAENTAARKEEKKVVVFGREIDKKTLDKFEQQDKAVMEQMGYESNDLVPGQLTMFMPAGGGEPQVLADENKMMRFQAGQVQKLMDKLDRISDQLGQILRRVDNGH